MMCSRRSKSLEGFVDPGNHPEGPEQREVVVFWSLTHKVLSFFIYVEKMLYDGGPSLIIWQFWGDIHDTSMSSSYS